MLKSKKLKPRLNVKRALDMEKEAPKAESKKKTKFEDKYTPEFDPVEVVMSDKYKLILTVQRDNENGLLELDIRTYQTTDLYTGFTKKGVRVPLEKVANLESAVYDILEKCEEHDLMEEAFEYEECGAREYAESYEE